MLTLGRGIRIQFERVGQQHVLLFPEGCVNLNGSATEILSRLPMQRTRLHEVLFNQYGTAEGFDAFVDHAIRMKWIREELLTPS